MTHRPIEELEMSPGLERAQDPSAILARQYITELHKALRDGNLKSVKSLIRENPNNALTDRISMFGDTAIHVAASAGHVKIVKELVHLTSSDQLERRNDYHETALTLAAAGGNTEVAKLLVEKNYKLLYMENKKGNIPVVVAAEFGRKDAVHFLYPKTPVEVLKETENNQCDRLLTACMASQLYDIALHMFKEYPELKKSQGELLYALATRDLASPGRSLFPALQHRIFSSCLASTIMRIHETKSKNVNALELLRFICKNLLILPKFEMAGILSGPIFKAVSCGNVEFIAEVAKIDSDVLYIEKSHEGLLSCAVLNGQYEVYSFLRSMGLTRFLLNSLDWQDYLGETILHQVARISPPEQLGRIASPVLQMQRELKWFKEVENILPVYKDVLNCQDKTPREVFTEEHKVLVTEGEKWIKTTATSCTVVAALIVTIMFAAAFTVPGGYKGDTGIAVHLGSNYFIIFIISDALSLLFSSTSVLAFLEIHTSLYREEDFLKTLPNALIFGLSTLFFSIVSMMVAFSATIVMILDKRFVRISIPVFILAAIPIIYFALPQLPLVFHFLVSTHIRSIYQWFANRKWLTMWSR